jgi:hypothetical protein
MALTAQFGPMTRPSPPTRPGPIWRSPACLLPPAPIDPIEGLPGGWPGLLRRRGPGQGAPQPLLLPSWAAPDAVWAANIPAEPTSCCGPPGRAQPAALRLVGTARGTGTPQTAPSTHPPHPPKSPSRCLPPCAARLLAGLVLVGAPVPCTSPSTLNPVCCLALVQQTDAQ